MLKLSVVNWDGHRFFLKNHHKTKQMAKNPQIIWYGKCCIVRKPEKINSVIESTQFWKT